ncbi:hypothetical protein D3C85_1276230 [compost metagenome]
MGQANPRRAHKPAASLDRRAVTLIASTMYSADPAFERGSFLIKKYSPLRRAFFISGDIIQLTLQRLLLSAGSCEVFQRS